MFPLLSLLSLIKVDIRNFTSIEHILKSSILGLYVQEKYIFKKVFKWLQRDLNQQPLIL